MWLISYKSRVILPSVFNTLNVMFKWGTKVGSTTAMMIATDNNTGSLAVICYCWWSFADTGICSSILFFYPAIRNTNIVYIIGYIFSVCQCI